MKNFLKSFILAMLLIMTSTIALQAQTTTYYSSRNNDEHVAKVINTTDSTLTYIDSIKLGTNQGGVAEVYVVGYAVDTAQSVTGKLSIPFNKARGTLTLGSITEVSPITRIGALLIHTAAGGATFTVVSVNDNIYIRVKGVTDASVPRMRWYSIVKVKSQATR